jgi:hypothetical protein
MPGKPTAPILGYSPEMRYPSIISIRQKQTYPDIAQRLKHSWTGMNQRKSDFLSGELLSFSIMFTKLGCHLILAKGEFLDSLN